MNQEDTELWKGDPPSPNQTSHELIQDSLASVVYGYQLTSGKRDLNISKLYGMQQLMQMLDSCGLISERNPANIKSSPMLPEP